MRKIFLAAFLIAVSFSLFAQDNSMDLYQQYLNQYKQEPKKEEPAPAAQPAAEKKEEPAPAAQPAEEKKEEAAQPAEEKKEEAAQPAEEKKEEAAPAEAAPAAEGDGKIAPFDTKPFFSVNAFSAISNSIYTFGGNVLPHSSYRFSVDNAVIDLKGGNHMFNGRILADLAKGLTTTKDVEINYDHDDELPTNYANPVEFAETGDKPNALDILKDVSFSMVHPSYRNAAGTFGLNVEVQAGLFGMPFGIESGYDHEITFAHSAIKNDFLGGAFRDVGVSLGFDFLFGDKMDLGLTLFVFNGKNETMLDGEDKFKDPAFGFDLRYKYESKFYATAAFSLVVGSAYIGYDEDSEYGIFNTTNGRYDQSSQQKIVEQIREKKMKNLLKEFKDFAMKGNVMDMAVGIIIGGAFGKIVTSVVNDVIMPLIGLIVGGVNFTDLAITLKEAVPAAEGVAAKPAVLLKYGNFLQTTFDFLIVAFSIFLFIKIINTAKEKLEKATKAAEEAAAAAAPAPAPDPQIVLLTEIRDLLKK